jgi:stage II sporulation protein D
LLATILPTETSDSVIRYLNKKLAPAGGLSRAAVLLFLLLLLCSCRGKRQVRPSPLTVGGSSQIVRVLLLDDVNDCTLKLDGDFVVSCPQTVFYKEFGRTDQPIFIRFAAGKFSLADLDFESNTIVITPGEPYIFNLNGSDYRGRLMLIADPNSGLLDAINYLPMQAYLAGVLAAEMPNYWEPEALKAQVITARTYGLYIKGKFGKNRRWDVGKTVAHQVYLGVRAESQAVRKAVEQTAGMVLTSRQGGVDGIFPAYYSSTCGGHTEDSKNVFGDSFEPLSGVPCPYCKDVAKPAIFSWESVQFNKKDVTDRLFNRYPRLKQLLDINDITISAKSDYGEFSRATIIELHGQAGRSDFLRAEDFRLAVDPTGNKIKSSCWQIIDGGDCWIFTAGRGFGHGVGMCQCGAEGLARLGKTAEQILQYYYPGSKIVTMK